MTFDERYLWDQRRDHTVPTGRIPFLHGFQAVNCLATIILSLRDKSIQMLSTFRLHITPSADYDDENDVPQSNPGGFKSTTLDAAW